MYVQRLSEVPDQLGIAILSVIPGNPLLWTFLMENFNLEIANVRYSRKSVISESGTSENLCIVLYVQESLNLTNLDLTKSLDLRDEIL